MSEQREPVTTATGWRKIWSDRDWRWREESLATEIGFITVQKRKEKLVFTFTFEVGFITDKKKKRKRKIGVYV